ncbi:hypothetical protein HYT58_00945 [Candidatus Woesearchaeota archaeon]|nr:hypothetical protein [Candidatus Woesearchaeota archaeon]
MKTYKNLYKTLCSIENLESAFKKAKKRKSKKPYVLGFEKNLKQNLNKLKQELVSQKYYPRSLERFTIKDPKSRVIHASHFRDRIVHHALINIMGPIFEKMFIYDSHANQINKGTHKAVFRFDKFKRKASKNGQLVKNSYNANSITGYALKADIKHYFDTVDHEILINILRKKIKDEDIIRLTQQILNNFKTETQGKGMPLGNMTSQFFANVYLNELDYFVKHKLKAKYYIRYVDDFIILHPNKNLLELWKQEISNLLKDKLKLELHRDKTKITPLRNGILLLGYNIFFHHKLLRKSNLKKFELNLMRKIEMYKNGSITKEDISSSIEGWFGYIRWANTHKLKRIILSKINNAISTTP